MKVLKWLLGNVLLLSAAPAAFSQEGFPLPPVGVLEIQRSLKCIDVSGSSTDEGALIIQQDCTDSTSQQFEIRPVDNGYYSFVNIKSGQCLDVYEASYDSGAQVKQWTCHFGPNQQFALKYTDGNIFSAVARHSGKCLDVSQGSTASGQEIWQWDCTGEKNQLFRQKPVGSNKPNSAAKSVLPVNNYLKEGEYLQSPNRKTYAILQSDGNYCVYRGAGPEDNQGYVWCAKNTPANGPFYAILQSDGNFCVNYGTDPSNSRGAYWCRGIEEKGASYYARLRDDGYMEVRSVKNGSFQQELTIDANTARKYAPRIHLHPEESYFPSSVEFFQPNVNQADGFMFTKEQLGCDSCTDPIFLDGQRPDQKSVPIYAEIVKRNGLPDNVTDIIYWAFFPYNNGKRVCVGLYAPFGVGCIGGYSTFGSHVGDWEHITLRFVDGYPQDLAFNAHESTRRFNWGSNNIEMVDAFHPVFYSAQGSHGFYEWADRHNYKNLPNGDSLIDDTGRGIAWDTWNNVVGFAYKTPGSYSGNLSWLNYLGRWGNPKSGCALVEKVTGECVLNDGPTAPMAKDVSHPGFTGLE